ncbi:MAG: hypothetical protein A2660_00210 [Candidatus Doudnabacteria bacterium RIFCSPHIGHO2_01_FULL_45_18]|uniref:Uncharacterized protein n=1 Tax=Candidatus Doudnabacteria bacterium RIFCSPHIGHO2_01_FULL_45_18 TaxID=1817823 RepID=A0A1F5NSR0_9BACT|nr:MAG: hypothetical protein A2660_00210 [Candidatus Doudnabacteria bacterium RIFCSPHIGHO2_01_FULL_45_18]
MPTKSDCQPVGIQKERASCAATRSLKTWRRPAVLEAGQGQQMPVHSWKPAADDFEALADHLGLESSDRVLPSPAVQIADHDPNRLQVEILSAGLVRDAVDE